MNFLIKYICAYYLTLHTLPQTGSQGHRHIELLISEHTVKSKPVAQSVGMFWY